MAHSLAQAAALLLFARAGALMLNVSDRARGTLEWPEWMVGCSSEMLAIGGANGSVPEDTFFDDGVDILSTPVSEVQTAALADLNVAYLWNKCAAPFKYVKFPVKESCVASGKHKFMYLENRKAGSTSIRQLFAEVLGLSWCNSDLPHKYTHGRMTLPSEFDAKVISSLFKFTFVRDPLAKFESGVREAWISNPKLKKYNADQLLDMQLARPISAYKQWSAWVQDHLSPSSWALATSTNEYYQAPIHVDFVGKTESMGAAWPTVVNSMTGLTSAQRYQLLRLTHSNTHWVDPRSKLSENGIKRMCASWLYGHEWSCFGYQLPAACRTR